MSWRAAPTLLGALLLLAGGVLVVLGGLDLYAALTPADPLGPGRWWWTLPGLGLLALGSWSLAVGLGVRSGQASR